MPSFQLFRINPFGRALSVGRHGNIRQVSNYSELTHSVGRTKGAARFKRHEFPTIPN